MRVKFTACGRSMEGVLEGYDVGKKIFVIAFEHSDASVEIYRAREEHVHRASPQESRSGQAACAATPLKASAAGPHKVNPDGLDRYAFRKRGRHAPADMLARDVIEAWSKNKDSARAMIRAIVERDREWMGVLPMCTDFEFSDPLYDAFFYGRSNKILPCPAWGHLAKNCILACLKFHEMELVRPLMESIDVHADSNHYRKWVIKGSNIRKTYRLFTEVYHAISVAAVSAFLDKHGNEQLEGVTVEEYLRQRSSSPQLELQTGRSSAIIVDEHMRVTGVVYEENDVICYGKFVSFCKQLAVRKPNANEDADDTASGGDDILPDSTVGTARTSGGHSGQVAVDPVGSFDSVSESDVDAGEALSGQQEQKYDFEGDRLTGELRVGMDPSLKYIFDQQVTPYNTKAGCPGLLKRCKDLGMSVPFGSGWRTGRILREKLYQYYRARLAGKGLVAAVAAGNAVTPDVMFATGPPKLDPAPSEANISCRNMHNFLSFEGPPILLLLKQMHVRDRDEDCSSHTALETGTSGCNKDGCHDCGIAKCAKNCPKAVCRCTKSHPMMLLSKAMLINVHLRPHKNYQGTLIKHNLMMQMIRRHKDPRFFNLYMEILRRSAALSEYGDDFSCQAADMRQEKGIDNGKSSITTSHHVGSARDCIVLDSAQQLCRIRRRQKEVETRNTVRNADGELVRDKNGRPIVITRRQKRVSPHRRRKEQRRMQCFSDAASTLMEGIVTADVPTQSHLIGTPACTFRSPDSIWSRATAARHNAAHATLVMATALSNGVPTRKISGLYPVSPTLHHVNSATEDTLRRKIASAERNAQEASVEAELTAQYIRLVRDAKQVFMGVDSKAGDGKSKICPILIGRYSNAFSACHGAAEVGNCIQAYCQGGEFLCECVDACQLLAQQPPRRQTPAGYTASRTVKELARDMLMVLCDTGKRARKKPQLLLLCLDDASEVTILRMLAWQKRGKVLGSQGQRFLAEHVKPVNEDVSLDKFCAEGGAFSYSKLWRNKQKMRQVYSHLAFQLRNDCESEHWIRPCKGDTAVQMIALIGGAGITTVTSTEESGTGTIKVGDRTVTARDLEKVLEKTHTQGQGESMILNAIWRLLLWSHGEQNPHGGKLFTFLIRSNDADCLVSSLAFVVALAKYWPSTHGAIFDGANFLLQMHPKNAETCRALGLLKFQNTSNANNYSSDAIHHVVPDGRKLELVANVQRLAQDIGSDNKLPEFDAEDAQSNEISRCLLYLFIYSLIGNDLKGMLKGFSYQHMAFVICHQKYKEAVESSATNLAPVRVTVDSSRVNFSVDVRGASCLWHTAACLRGRTFKAIVAKHGSDKNFMEIPYIHVRAFARIGCEATQLPDDTSWFCLLSCVRLIVHQLANYPFHLNHPRPDPPATELNGTSYFLHPGGTVGITYSADKRSLEEQFHDDILNTTFPEDFPFTSPRDTLQRARANNGHKNIVQVRADRLLPFTDAPLISLQALCTWLGTNNHLDVEDAKFKTMSSITLHQHLAPDFVLPQTNVANGSGKNLLEATPLQMLDEFISESTPTWPAESQDLLNTPMGSIYVKFEGGDGVRARTFVKHMLEVLLAAVDKGTGSDTEAPSEVDSESDTASDDEITDDSDTSSDDEDDLSDASDEEAIDDEGSEDSSNSSWCLIM